MKTGEQKTFRHAIVLRKARIHLVLITSALFVFGGCANAKSGISISSLKKQPEQASLSSRMDRLGFSNATHPDVVHWRKQTLQRLMMDSMGWPEEGVALRIALEASQAIWPYLVEEYQSKGPDRNPWESIRIDPIPIHVLAMEARSIEMFDLKPEPDVRLISIEMTSASAIMMPLGIEQAVSSTTGNGDMRFDDQTVEAGMQIAGLAMLSFIFLVPLLCNTWASWSSTPEPESPQRSRHVRRDRIRGQITFMTIPRWAQSSPGHVFGPFGVHTHPLGSCARSETEPI